MCNLPIQVIWNKIQSQLLYPISSTPLSSIPTSSLHNPLTSYVTTCRHTSGPLGEQWQHARSRTARYMQSTSAPAVACCQYWLPGREPIVWSPVTYTNLLPTSPGGCALLFSNPHYVPTTERVKSFALFIICAGTRSPPLLLPNATHPNRPLARRVSEFVPPK